MANLAELKVQHKHEPACEEYAFNEAEALLEQLVPWREPWCTFGPEAWWFRGQRDADWRLVPSACRSNGFSLRVPGKRGRVKAACWLDQVRNEGVVVEDFVGVCLRSGQPIPEDSQWFRSYDLRKKFFATDVLSYQNGTVWPPPIERSLFALAQHHGVPTRLLDWTQLPLVAAYFACGKVVRTSVTNPLARCAVFALQTHSAFGLLGPGELSNYADGRPPTPYPDPSLEPVSAPYDANPNLRAQRGAFTLVAYRETSNVRHPLPTIEEVLEAALPSIPKPPPVMLVKFTLPHSECRHLLKLLARANVHAGTVFPGYDGAVRALREREFWYDP